MSSIKDKIEKLLDEQYMPSTGEGRPILISMKKFKEAVGMLRGNFVSMDRYGTLITFDKDLQQVQRFSIGEENIFDAEKVRKEDAKRQKEVVKNIA